MANEDFEKKMKDALSKGASESKKAFQKAGSAIQKFSDKSIVKIEKQQLVNKRGKLYKEMGEKFSELLLVKGIDVLNLTEAVEKQPELKDKITEIKSLQKEITSLNKQIKEKDAALKGDEKKADK